MNRFADAESRTVPTFNVDPEVERRQIERVRALRAGRSEPAWNTAIGQVRDAATGGGNDHPIAGAKG